MGRPTERRTGPAPDAAILLPHLRMGGAELSMLRLARGLAGQGRLIDIVALRCDGPLAALLGDGVRGIDLAAPSTLRALPQLVGYLRRERPTALIAAQPHLNLAAVAASRLAAAGTAVILTEHAPPSLEIAFYGGWRYRVLRRLAPPVYRLADRVVGVSRGICDELQSLLPGSAVDLVYNPVVPDDVAELARRPAPHPWLDDGGAPVVMGVGRLAPEKDFPSLVRAVARIARVRPVRLMILGEGPERSQIAAVAAENGLTQLAMPGRVDNVFAYLSRASVFALTSLFEGFGNVAVEALACGTAVVATDCPVGPREILEGGRFGRLVPPGDMPALARAIDAALDDGAPPPDLGPHLRKFTVAASVERYGSMIEAAARHAPARARTGSDSTSRGSSGPEPVS